MEEGGGRREEEINLFALLSKSAASSRNTAFSA